MYAMEISPVYVDVAVQRYTRAIDKIIYLDGSGGKTFADVASEHGVEINE